MEHDEYLDLLKRIICLSEAMLDMTALVTGIGGLMVAKGVCTQEELEAAKKAVYETASLKEAMRRLNDTQAQIKELEEMDPEKMFRDFIDCMRKGE